jgi:hypothetical protein
VALVALYSFLCPTCDAETISFTFAKIGVTIPESCDGCGNIGIVRSVSNINIALSMPDHFNASLGKYVSNHGQFKDGLKAKSEEMSARMGTDINYSEVDISDKKALGVSQDVDMADSIKAETNPIKRQNLDRVLS